MKRTWIVIAVLSSAWVGCAHQPTISTEDAEARSEVAALKQRMDQLENKWQEAIRAPVLDRVYKSLQDAHDELTRAKLEYWAERERTDALKSRRKERKR